MLRERHHLKVYEKRRLETSEKQTDQKPLLAAKQRAARPKFASSMYKNLTAKQWDDFLFSDAKCPKYLFQLPNPKNDVNLEFSRKPSFSSISGFKNFKMDHLGQNDRSQSHWDIFFSP